MNNVEIIDKFNLLTVYNPTIKYKEMYDNKKDIYYTAWVIKVELNQLYEVFWDRELTKVLDTVLDYIKTHKWDN